MKNIGTALQISDNHSIMYKASMANLNFSINLAVNGVARVLHVTSEGRQSAYPRLAMGYRRSPLALLVLLTCASCSSGESIEFSGSSSSTDNLATVSTGAAVPIGETAQPGSSTEVDSIDLGAALPTDNESTEGLSPVSGGGATIDPSTGLLSATFSQIADGGLSNACYLDNDHYAAEFLYQNPDVCFWDLDAANQTVTEVAVPTPPSDAVQLPAPSGGDDTSALESIINAQAGRSYVGQGVYNVRELDINVSADIFDMPMEPASGSGRMVVVNAADVRIFNSPIDAKDSSSIYIGYNVSNGAHRFTLVNSGFSNIHHTGNSNAAGVFLRGVDDFHLACNSFENIINETSSDVTARANSFWMNGGNSETTSGGYIVNNYSYNHQSNGSLNDAEFFTEQNYSSTDFDKPVKIFANRLLEAGKRFTKHQEDNALVLSNFQEWRDKIGTLGSRSLLANVEVQTSDNIIARNNRVKIAAESRFDYVFITQVRHGTEVQDNIHYDCNDIEIADQLPTSSNNVPQIITARIITRPEDSTGFEATNSSASFNNIHGDGSVRFFYSFGDGYDDQGGSFDTQGNVFDIDFVNAIYK